MSELVLAVDQGTTGTTCLVVTPTGEVLGRGYREHPQSYPKPGWVEHDADAIWQCLLDSGADALAGAGITGADIAAVGITNQRESIVSWDSVTRKPLCPVLVWQDRRTAEMCAQLREAGHGPRIRELAGLPVDPYFSGSKVAWLLRNTDAVRGAQRAGTLRLGTIDTWLVDRMSGGSSFVTDASNAARTMLYDIGAGRWSDELCALFDVDPSTLAQVVDCSGVIAQCEPGGFLGISAPVSGMAGDQQSALFGQACVQPGLAKATYGTGAFVLVNAGDSAPHSDHLIGTVAWSIGGQHTYALEGSVFTAGASVQWLRDGLQIIASAPETEALAASVPDTGGTVLVPAFAGLGAPTWDAHARAAIMGITRGTTRAHIARATLEAVAFRVTDLVRTMDAEGTTVSELRVDGGMAANNLLLQMQADLLQIPVTRPTHVETTSLGAAYLAAHGCGLLPDLNDVAQAWQTDRVFEPSPDAGALHERYRIFGAAVGAVRSFAAATADTHTSVYA